MNIKKYYLYNIFKDLMPIYPLYLLMFQSRGLSVIQISFLLVIWSVSGVILEIPTGILADRWSRKNMIFLGELFKALCFMIWFFADGFMLYAVGFAFWGVGCTFQSGAEEALLFDSLKTCKAEERFDIILGKGHFLSGISNILAALSGGFIGAYFGFQSALFLSVLSGLIAIGIVLSLKEVNLYKEHLQKPDTDSEKDTLKNAIFFLAKSKEVLLLSLLGVFVITTAGVLDEYDQLIAKEYGLTIKLIGIWTAIRFIMISLGSYIARGLRIVVEKLFQLKYSMYSIGFLCVIAAIFLMISGSVRQIGIMGLYGLYYLIMSAGEILQEDYIQQKIYMEGRATIHSLMSLSKNLYGILFYTLFGVLISHAGLFMGLVYVGVYIVMWTLVILLINKYWNK